MDVPVRLDPRAQPAASASNAPDTSRATATGRITNTRQFQHSLDRNGAPIFEPTVSKQYDSYDDLPPLVEVSGDDSDSSYFADSESDDDSQDGDGWGGATLPRVDPDPGEDSSGVSDDDLPDLLDPSDSESSSDSSLGTTSGSESDTDENETGESDDDVPDLLEPSGSESSSETSSDTTSGSEPDSDSSDDDLSPHTRGRHAALSSSHPPLY